MNILAINGSGRGKGNTETLLKAFGSGLPEDVNYEIIDLNRLTIRGCTGCEGCATSNRCVVKDDMQALYPKIEAADGLILASPTYFYNISAGMKAFIERLYPYEVFDLEDRSVWVSATESQGLKYASVVAVCEQEDEKDMGFTAEAMSMPLEALGYRVVSTEKVMHLFGKSDAEGALDVKATMKQAGVKLYKTIRLAKFQGI